MIITIDGPAGSGKSTVAQKIAQQLGIFYLNTGLLYRAVAYLLATGPLKAIDPQDAPEAFCAGISDAALAALPTLRYFYANAVASVTVAGQDITAHLFATPGISQLASQISALPRVRAYLLDVQRAVAREHDVVADGRDCGSVVFPDAAYKFFLTASIEERAKRRLFDTKSGTTHDAATLEAIKADIAQRDARDQNRAIAPLIRPEGALEIDSSGLAIDDVVQAMLACLKK